MTQRKQRVQETAPPSEPSTTRQSTPPAKRRTSIMTTAEIHKNVKNTALGLYVGTPGLPSTANFFPCGSLGDILISTTTHDEIILRGAFQISRNEFFLQPDGCYRDTNIFGSEFTDVRLSCKLLIPHHEEFQFMSKDLDLIMKNVKGFEALIKRGHDDTFMSAIQTSGGVGAIKMIHRLFTKIDDDENANSNVDEHHDKATEQADLLGSEFSPSNWPVDPKNKERLKEIIDGKKHILNPLPVYDIDHTPLPPSRYMKLSGAIVLASLAFAHHHVKSSKRHVFNAPSQETTIWLWTFVGT
ncbi:hypothetical protein JVU11DRAFT_8475 [Chiua virens]|nr:hypothetical protein JVU11DRAFT_8475 [Chiua virens]